MYECYTKVKVTLIYIVWIKSTKDDFLEIKFNDKNQVNDKIALGLDGGLLSIHSSFFS